MQDKRAKALLEQPAFQDGEGLKEAAIAMLAHCSPSQEVAVVGEDQLQTCMLLSCSFVSQPNATCAKLGA